MPAQCTATTKLLSETLVATRLGRCTQQHSLLSGQACQVRVDTVSAFINRVAIRCARLQDLAIYSNQLTGGLPPQYSKLLELTVS